MDKKETKSKPTAANPKSKTVKETKSKPIIANPNSKKEAKFKTKYKYE
jgi:hypothetical protein